MSFHLRNNSGEYPSESRWSILQGQYNGKPMFVRRNDSAKQLSSNPEFNCRVGFAIPLLVPNEAGLPSNEEMEALNQIEDELSRQLEKDNVSILALTITTGGMREFVFYTKDSKIVEEIVESVRSKFLSHKIQYYVEEDKEWSLYTEFV